MKSFIYDDKNLLNKLFVLAQEQELPTQVKLNNTAIDLIRNLKSQLSPFKANSNPTDVDLQTLNSFKNWAQKSGAAWNGNLLVEDDQFNNDILGKFLGDLRDRATKNPYVAEHIASLIEQSKLNIPIYTSTQNNIDNKETAKTLKPGEGGSKGQLGFSADSSTAEERAKEEEKNKQQNQLGNSTHAFNIDILHGNEIDFINVHKDLTLAADTLGKIDNKVPNLAQNIASRIIAIKSAFDNIIRGKMFAPTGFSGLSPDAGGRAFQTRIEADFNGPSTMPGTKSQYNDGELAVVANCFSQLAGTIAAFYNSLTGKQFDSFRSEITQQMKMAEEYQHNFIEASSQFNMRFSKPR